MLKDIHLEFPGFHGSRGRCQVRLARLGNDKPLVIVCSQYWHYYGTSILNAHDIIADTLLYKIANGQIDDVSLDLPLPVFREWHDDANLLDKLLARLFPRKYGERFEHIRLDIPAVLSKLVWLENFPPQSQSFGLENRCHLVTRDKDGRPSWHGRPDDHWLIRNTGFKLAELLPSNEALDLTSFEATRHHVVTSGIELRSLPGYSAVRWTMDLLDFLPAMLDRVRERCGRSASEDLEEAAIQLEMEQFFATRLPARELFEREYPFSKDFGIHERGREKAVDFVVFTPQGRRIDSIIEIKRTSSKSGRFGSQVKSDLSRLVLLADHYRCSCYLIVCGDGATIAEQLGLLFDYLSFADNEIEQDRHFTLQAADFRDEYRTMVETSSRHGSSRFLGMREHGPNQVALWQVTGAAHGLQTHRPYTFLLSEVPS